MIVFPKINSSCLIMNSVSYAETILPLVAFSMTERFLLKVIASRIVQLVPKLPEIANSPNPVRNYAEI